MTGEEFEQLVAEKMRSYGWFCISTPLSNDFGADVVCTREDEKIVIQCKCYDELGSIGNSAVYEAYAAVAHYKAQKGIVVYKGRPTRGAKALCTSTGVELYHISEIEPGWKYDRSVQRISSEREERQARERESRLHRERSAPKPRYRLDPLDSKRRIERCKGCGDELSLPIASGRFRLSCSQCGTSALY